MKDRNDWQTAITATILLLLFSISTTTPSLAQGVSKDILTPPEEMLYKVDDDVYHVYQKPTWFGWMLRGPSNLKSVWDRTFRKDNLDALASIAASSALLIAYDEEILLGSQKLARKVGLISDSKSGREINYLFKEQVNGVDLPIYVPANTNSTLYYIGDGYTQLGIVSSMVGYGLWNNDYRALSAASQNVEALFITGIMIQLFKRTTGREAPFRRTEEGGKWQWFPNQEDYNKDVPKYDAFPSGHLATAMAATTVFADNYPDHAYIKPVGYTLMGLLAFGMLNNGVHWAGDYPLGIAIGYTSAKVVTSRIKKRGVIVSERTDKAKWQFVPTMIGTAPAIGYRYTH